MKAKELLQKCSSLDPEMEVYWGERPSDLQKVNLVVVTEIYDLAYVVREMSCAKNRKLRKLLQSEKACILKP